MSAMAAKSAARFAEGRAARRIRSGGAREHLVPRAEPGAFTIHPHPQRLRHGRLRPISVAQHQRGQVLRGGEIDPFRMRRRRTNQRLGAGCAARRRRRHRLERRPRSPAAIPPAVPPRRPARHRPSPADLGARFETGRPRRRRHTRASRHRAATNRPAYRSVPGATSAIGVSRHPFASPSPAIACFPPVLPIAEPVPAETLRSRRTTTRASCPSAKTLTVTSTASPIVRFTGKRPPSICGSTRSTMTRRAIAATGGVARRRPTVSRSRFSAATCLSQCFPVSHQFSVATVAVSAMSTGWVEATCSAGSSRETEIAEARRRRRSRTGGTTMKTATERPSSG